LRATLDDDKLKLMNTTLAPDLRRSRIHQKVDTASEGDLEQVEKLLFDLEFDRLFNKVRDSFGRAADEGKLDNADEVIAAVRADRRKRSA
jgi:hypothetical protein